MPKKTPFHTSFEAFNETGIWKHWSGYLVAPRYQYSVTAEYYSIRNSVSLLDTSPLFKYKFAGKEAEKYLCHLLSRDIRKCKIGQAQYTAWCDPKGFLLQDGVILRTQEDEYFLTAAEPTQWYFHQVAKKAGLHQVVITDVSNEYGILALQGPHANNVLSQICDVDSMKYFAVTCTKINGCDVIVSRTGFTGDLGYEIWVRSDDATQVFFSLMSAGQGYNITLIGTTALKMSRVEPGLLLMGVDFDSARFAWVDAQRETVCELGWNWMFRNLSQDNREFIGREAIENEINNRSSRWKTVGLEIDWHDYERVHAEAGIMPPQENHYLETTMSIYRRTDKPWDYAGYATSLLFSPLLKKPIALAKLPLDLTKPGTEVDLELNVIRRPVNVVARVAKLPFFDPARKTQMFKETLDV